MDTQAKKIRIALTGGGTGGHVEPLLAVIDELRKEPVELIWIGQDTSLESKAALAAQVPFRSILAGKMRRYFDWENVTDVLKVCVGYFQSLYILWRFRPDVLFSKAGYVSVPPLLAAATLGVPIVAHESDTVIGLANHIAHHLAKRFCTGFPLPYYSHDLAKKTVFTGNPVRRATELIEKPFDLESSKPVVLVTGASQGAQQLNEVVWHILPQLLHKAQVIHVVGPSHLAEAKRKAAAISPDLRKHYMYDGYFDQDQLSFALQKAACAVARAGANTIADFSRWGVPAILVPLPTAAANHQMINAQYVVDRGGAILLDQSQLQPSQLLETILGLLENDAKRRAMARAMRDINPPDAAARVATEVMNVAIGKG